MTYSAEVLADSPLAYWRLGDLAISITSATASEWFGSEPPGNAIDYSAATNWSTNGSALPQWWRANLASAVAVVSYSIRRRDDIPNRNPTAWTFQGSNDATSWTTLDTRSGVTWPTAGQTQTFTFTNTTTYTYYRLNISANAGDTYTSITEISLADASGTTSAPAMVDSAGSARNGAYTGVPTFGAASLLASDTDKSVSFNGTTQYGSVADAAWMDVSQIALEAWINPTNVSSYRSIVDRDGGGGGPSRVFQFRITSAGKLEFLFWTTSGGPFTCTGTTTLAANTTYHVAATFDGTNAKLYINGALEKTLAQTGSLKVATVQTSVGASMSGSGGAQFFQGRIDEVAYYGTALTSTRILAHYNAGITAGPLALGSAATASDVALSATLTSTLGLASATADDVALSADLTVIPTSIVVLDAATADDLTLAADLTLASHLDLGTAATGDDVALSADLTLVLVSGIALTASTGSDVALAATLNTDLIHLLPWTADTSQKTLLEIVLSDAELVVNPPIAVAPDGLGGPGPGGTGGPLVVERMLRRESHVMPVPTPDADGHVRVSEPWTIIEAEVGVLHVFVSGKDVTYFRGAPTVVDEWNAAEPFGDVSAQVSFPQLTQWDDPGAGDVAWLHPGASVEIILLDMDGVTRHRRFAGHFISDETGSGEDDISNVWQAEGSLYQSDHVGIQVPTILNPTDIGTLIRKALNGVPSRRFGMPTNTMTGIPSRYRGGIDDSPMDYAQALLGRAWNDAGTNQWTVAKIPNTTRGFEVRLKNRTTVNWTVTAGAPGIELNLSSDLLGTITEVWGRGISPDGYGWSGMCYPKFLDDDAPPFPFTNPDAIITIGTTDADTDSGTGVSTWQRRVNELNLTPDVVVDGVYNSSDAAICLRIQRDYGLLEDEKIGGQTWTATFAVGSSGGDLTGARRRPLAILRTVEQNLYSANGAIIGPNPDYDPKIMRFRRDEDFGTCTKAEATRSAIAELARDKDPGLTGSMTFTTDPHNGSRWLIDEGHNIRVNGYRGRNPLLHVADVRAIPETYAVTINVDEHARDAMTLASIRANARDAAADPARRPGAVDKRSRMEQDITVPFDGESEGGQIPRHAIHGGLWSVIHIPVSQVGRISKIELATQSPAAKFCVAFFSAEVTPAHLQHLVGDPLAGTDPFNKDEAHANALRALGIIEAFGGPGQAAGYWPRTEDKGAPLTGKFKDGGGMEYVSQLPPWVWIAEWSPVSTFISGRVYPAPIQ